MTLGTDEFIRRFLLHVLPRGFHRIRHYGLLASSVRKASLARARELLAISPPPDDDVLDQPSDVRPPCPCCGGQMIVVEMFARWSQPRAPPHCTPPAGRILREPARTASFPPAATLRPTLSRVIPSATPPSSLAGDPHCSSKPATIRTDRIT